MARSHPRRRPGRRQFLGWGGVAVGSSAAGFGPFLGGCAGAPPEDETTEPGADESDESGGADGAFTVYWNAGHAYDAYDEVVRKFEQDHDIEVNFQKYQWEDLRTRLLSDFASGTVPDLVEESGGWVQEFALSGDAMSLQEYVDHDGDDMGFPDDWQPQTIDRNSYSGEVYGIQLHLTCTLLLYNQEMLHEAGVEVPTTWGELLQAAQELTRDGVHGIVLNQDSSYSWPWLLQNGVRYYDPDSEELLVPHQRAIEALRFQADLVHEHEVSPVPTPGTDYSRPQKLLSAGRAAMILTGPWDLLPIEETSPDLQLGIAPALRNREQSTVQAGTSVFVPAEARHPDLAWDLIKRLTALDVEREATSESGMLMPRLSWTEQSEVVEDDRYAAFADAFEYAIDTDEELRLTGASGEIVELYDTLYQNVVMNNAPVEEALETFLDEAEQVLAG